MAGDDNDREQAKPNPGAAVVVIGATTAAQAISTSNRVGGGGTARGGSDGGPVDTAPADTSSAASASVDTASVDAVSVAAGAAPGRTSRPPQRAPMGSGLGGEDVLALLYNEAKQTIAGWCQEAERSAAELIASAELKRQRGEQEARLVLEQARVDAEQMAAEARRAEHEAHVVLEQARADATQIITEARRSESQLKRLEQEARLILEQARADGAQIIEAARAEGGQIVATARKGEGRPGGQTAGAGSVSPRVREATGKLSSAVDRHLGSLEETMTSMTALTRMIQEVDGSDATEALVRDLRARIDELASSVGIMLAALEQLRQSTGRNT